MMFRHIDDQSPSVWSRGLPRYRNVVTFPTLYSTPPFQTELHLPTPLCHLHISPSDSSLHRLMTLVRLTVLKNPGCRNVHPTLVTPWKRFRTLLHDGHLQLPVLIHEMPPKYPQVFSLAGHPSTGHSTNLQIHGNNTL